MREIQKVLIVDDDANIRTIAEMSLEGLTDWQLRLADSAEQAMSLINAEKSDLILLDMTMPDTDGVTFFGNLRTTFGGDCPAVILLSAKVQAHEVARYQSLGAVGVITKPFDPMTLPAEIMQLLECSATN